MSSSKPNDQKIKWSRNTEKTCFQMTRPFMFLESLFTTTWVFTLAVIARDVVENTPLDTCKRKHHGPYHVPPSIVLQNITHKNVFNCCKWCLRVKWPTIFPFRQKVVWNFRNLLFPTFRLQNTECCTCSVNYKYFRFL